MLEIGFIGAGGIANAHADCIAALEQCRVAAVIDVDGAKAEKLAEKSGGRVCGTVDEVIAKSEAVFICTPPFARLEETLACARAGKHIFAEKPICLKIGEARAIARAVAEARVRFMVGYVLHYWPAFKAAHDVVAGGELGDLQVCWCNRMGVGPRGGWIEDPSKSGGMTVEFNSHDIDWLRWVGGEVREVYGKTLTVPGDGIERNVWAVLTFEQGIGILGSSWAAPIGWSVFGAIGSQGMVFCGQDGTVRKRLSGGEETPVELEDIGNSMLAEDRHFVESVLAGKDPEIGMAAAVGALEVSLAIQKSSALSQPVRLPLED